MASDPLTINSDAQVQYTQRRTWWTINWKWFVPLGCIFGLIVTISVFVIVVFTFIFGMMTSSDAYRDAVLMAESNAQVQTILGTPIEAGWFVTGKISINGSSGHADIAIPISGPNAEAVIYAVSTKAGGTWVFSQLLVEVTGTNQSIDLLKVE